MLRKYGVDYVRMPRRKVVKIYESGETFTPGKAKLLREGIDVTLIASGVLVAEALKAAELLASRGIQARVVDMFTIKPIDLDCVRECAEKTGCVVTAENHSVIGGLGSAVAEALGETHPVPHGAHWRQRIVRRSRLAGLWLMDHFGLRAENIVQAAIRVIERKHSLTY